tara:strand:- start:1058 stop:1567 length:510 start_codon:yes stop_codon:yes gene_type:complete
MTSIQEIPEEKDYLLRKNEFQGVVTMPKEVKKKLILQDSQKKEEDESLLKQALMNSAIKNPINIYGIPSAVFPAQNHTEPEISFQISKPTPLTRQWTVVDELLWWKNGTVLEPEPSGLLDCTQIRGEPSDDLCRPEYRWGPEILPPPKMTRTVTLPAWEFRDKFINSNL